MKDVLILNEAVFTDFKSEGIEISSALITVKQGDHKKFSITIKGIIKDKIELLIDSVQELECAYLNECFDIKKIIIVDFLINPQGANKFFSVEINAIEL